MYFTPRGKDLREQKILDFSTAQKFLDAAVFGKNPAEFFRQLHIRKIVIAPFNHFGKCLAAMLKEQDVEVLFFADRMHAKYGDNLWGIPIVPYEALKEDAIEAVVVTSNYYANEIIDTLMEAGVPLEKIIGINTILYGMERMPSQ